jgi:DNA-directed RNA polymerase specialized sigma24 family protein
MDHPKHLDEPARELLAALAERPDEDLARRFDALLYEYVWRYLRARSETIASRVARYTSNPGIHAPRLQAGELAEVAHEATTIALRRVRQKAGEFDPARGGPVSWVIGAAEYAYVEVAKAIAAARRSSRLSFQDPQDLLDVPDWSPSTEEHVISKLSSEQALREAAEVLSDHEFAALRLVDTLKFTYAEAAEVMFGEANMERTVEGLLRRGRRRLAAVWQEHKPSVSGSPTGKVSRQGVENSGKEHV